MKIIHCADIHLNSPLLMALDNAEARRNEIFATFASLLEYAKKNCVQVVLIAGDLFDEQLNASENVVSEVAFKISQYPEIDFLYLAGNHEKKNPFLERKIYPDNLKLFSADEWKSFEYGDVVITGRELSNSPTLYQELNLDSGKVNIVCLHGDVNNQNEINLKMLQHRGIDYLALGHLHSYEYKVLDERGKYCYAGCLEGRGFDELGEKGFVELDIENKQITSRFVPFAKRKIFGVIEVDISGLEDYGEIANKVISTLESQGVSQDDLIKEVKLIGEVSEMADIDSMCKSLSTKLGYYYLKVKNNTKYKIDYSLYLQEASLRGRFVKLVEESDLSSEEKANIIGLGLRFIAGEGK